LFANWSEGIALMSKQKYHVVWWLSMLPTLAAMAMFAYQYYQHREETSFLIYAIACLAIGVVFGCLLVGTSTDDSKSGASKSEADLSKPAASRVASPVTTAAAPAAQRRAGPPETPVAVKPVPEAPVGVPESKNVPSPAVADDNPPANLLDASPEPVTATGPADPKSRAPAPAKSAFTLLSFDDAGANAVGPVAATGSPAATGGQEILDRAFLDDAIASMTEVEKATADKVAVDSVLSSLLGDETASVPASAGSSGSRQTSSSNPDLTSLPAGSPDGKQPVAEDSLLDDLFNPLDFGPGQAASPAPQVAPAASADAESASRAPVETIAQKKDKDMDFSNWLGDEAPQAGTGPAAPVKKTKKNEAESLIAELQSEVEAKLSKLSKPEATMDDLFDSLAVSETKPPQPSKSQLPPQPQTTAPPQFQPPAQPQAQPQQSARTQVPPQSQTQASAPLKTQSPPRPQTQALSQSRPQPQAKAPAAPAKPEKVIPKFKPSNNNLPDYRNVKDWLQHAEKMLAQKNPNDAVRSWDRVTTMDAKNFQAWYLKAITLRDMGFPEDALYSINCALGLQNKHLDALLEKALCLVDMGNNEQAVAWFDKALSVDKASIKAMLGKGLSLSAMSRHRDAVACFDKVLAVEAGNQIAADARKESAAKLGMKS
jgi:hypothetical protein